MCRAGGGGLTGICQVRYISPEYFGPASVRKFVEGSRLLGDRTADQWQQDAFGQVDAWLGGIGLRQP
ncbi:MAG: hypothetical protein F4X97_11985 [Boseongicola sp. SB0662_bin_57]|nr:hypothetical protein [Boseongicola sp. SB0662_bin_57]